MEAFIRSQQSTITSSFLGFNNEKRSMSLDSYDTSRELASFLNSPPDVSKNDESNDEKNSNDVLNIYVEQQVTHHHQRRSSKSSSKKSRRRNQMRRFQSEDSDISSLHDSTGSIPGLNDSDLDGGVATNAAKIMAKMHSARFSTRHNSVPLASELKDFLAAPAVQPRQRKKSWDAFRGAIDRLSRSSSSGLLSKQTSATSSLYSSNEDWSSLGSDEQVYQFRIIQVQEKFPQDKLELSLSLDEYDRKHLHRAPVQNTPPIRTRKSNFHPELERSNSEAKSPGDECEHGGRASPTPTSMGVRRAHVVEGAVKLSSQTSTNERYFILFNDLLLVAKPKSQSTYKLKERVRVSELWISNCIEEVAEQVCPADNKAFVIGWPTLTAHCSYVAAFGTTEEKDLWQNALEKAIADRRKEEELKDITIKVCNLIHEDTVGPQQSTLFNVNQSDDARAVIKMALGQFQCQNDDPNEYQLWLSSKDPVQYPLLGHELPYAIKSNHTRNMCCQTPDENNNSAGIITDPNVRCHFILKKGKKGSFNRHHLDKNPRGWKNPMKKSPIIHWAMNKQKSVKSPYPMQNELLPPGKLFGNPLTQMSSDEEPIPKPIQDILVNLFRKGPGTTGIFRKSANQRTAKHIRQCLDTGKEVDIEERSAIVLATVLKDFFRSLPESLICSQFYDEICNSKNVTDCDARLEEIKRLLHQLPKENYEIMMKFMCVLHHIQRFSDKNNMNAYNLSVCVSPSVMKPKDPQKAVQGCEQTSNAIDVIQFIITNFVNIFSVENEYCLGPDTDIIFDEGPGEDSDSGTDQCGRERDISLDDGDDSEKETEQPTPEILFTPNIDSPFGHSDSSIGTNDSDELRQSFNRINGTTNNSRLIPEMSRSKSTPSSPLSMRRDEDMDSGVSYENLRNQSDMSDFEDPHDQCFQRNLLRQPQRAKRVLSNTSTSTELIEHKRHMPEVSDYLKKNSDTISKRNGGCYDILSPTNFDTVEVKNASPREERNEASLYPKKQIMAQPLVQHFATEIYTTPEIIAPAKPNVVFHTVDKRKQPAAPSYAEHIQRTQSKYRSGRQERSGSGGPHQQQQQARQVTPSQPIPIKTEEPVRIAQAVRNPKFNKKPQVQRHSVDNYAPPKPTPSGQNSSKSSDNKSSKPKSSHSHGFSFMHSRKNKSQNRNNRNGGDSSSANNSFTRNSRRDSKNSLAEEFVEEQQQMNSITQLQNEHLENQMRNTELATQTRDDILTTHNKDNPNHHSSKSINNSNINEKDKHHGNNSNNNNHGNSSNYSPHTRHLFSNHNNDNNINISDRQPQSAVNQNRTVNPTCPVHNARKVNEMSTEETPKKEKITVTRQAGKVRVPRISVTAMVKDGSGNQQQQKSKQLNHVTQDAPKPDSKLLSEEKANNGESNQLSVSAIDQHLMTEVVPNRENCKISREGRKTFRSSTKLRLSPNVSPVRKVSNNEAPILSSTNEEKIVVEEPMLAENVAPLQMSPSTEILATLHLSPSKSDSELSSTNNVDSAAAKSSGPFSLNVVSSVNKLDALASNDNSPIFQLDKSTLTKATKNDLLPINQLTRQPSLTRDDALKSVSAKELRRTSRKLKSEFRTFGDGKIVNTPREEKRAIGSNHGLTHKVLTSNLNGHYSTTTKDAPLKRGMKIQVGNASEVNNKENVTNRHNTLSKLHAKNNELSVKTHDNLRRTKSHEQPSVESMKAKSAGSSAAHEAFTSIMSQEESYV